MICVEKPIFSHLGKLDPFFEKVDSAFNVGDAPSLEAEKREQAKEGGENNINDENAD